MTPPGHQMFFLRFPSNPSKCGKRRNSCNSCISSIYLTAKMGQRAILYQLGIFMVAMACSIHTVLVSVGKLVSGGLLVTASVMGSGSDDRVETLADVPRYIVVSMPVEPRALDIRGGEEQEGEERPSTPSNSVVSEQLEEETKAESNEANMNAASHHRSSHSLPTIPHVDSAERLRRYARLNRIGRRTHHYLPPRSASSNDLDGFRGRLVVPIQRYHHDLDGEISRVSVNPVPLQRGGQSSSDMREEPDSDDSINLIF